MTRLNFSDLPPVLNDAIAACIRAAEAREGILLVGPPGVGKTALARRITSALEPLTDQESRWLTVEYKGAGLGPVTNRPFRAPHHSVSDFALAGGPTARYRGIGELRLARFGVLFLDELPEFRFTALNALYEQLPRLGNTAPLIVASAYACPCSWYGSERSCVCSEAALDRYTTRLEKYASNLGLTARIEVPSAVARDFHPPAETGRVSCAKKG